MIDDLSHAVAHRLTRRDEQHPPCAPCLAACGQGAGHRQHTVLAGRTPPTVPTQARLMPGHRVVRWADRVRGLVPAGRAKAGAVRAPWRTCLDDVPAWRTLLRPCRDDAVALVACHKRLTTPGLPHDTLPQCAPLLDPMAAVRGRQACARSLPHPLARATALGLETVGVPIRSDPIDALLGLTKQPGAGPRKDANRLARRLPALCGVPTREAAGQGREIPVAQPPARTEGVPP